MFDHLTIGMIAGLIAIAANPPYIWAILKGRTKPDRVTWWILAGLNTLIFMTTYSLGAWDTLWVPLGYAVSFSCIAILSVFYGEGSPAMTALQKICVAGAVASAIVWWFSGSALLALVLTIIIDFLGIVPTIYKSYLRPWHEDRLAWGIAYVATVLYLFAIDEWAFAMALYPVYLMVTNTVLVILIFRPYTKTARP